MNSHSVRMLIGCLVPLALIFVLPLFGVGEGVTLFVFIILMLGCHLMMLGGHGKHEHHNGDKGVGHDSH